MPGAARSISDAPDVVIVGAGIVGCSAAAFLAEGGARVTVLELADVAAGASGRNSGVVQHPFDPALRDLYRETVEIYRDLADATDQEFAFGPEPAGVLLVGLEPDGPRRLSTALRERWPELDPSFIAGDELRRLEPALAPGVAACQVRIGFPVPPASATRAFAALARRRGARVATGTCVAELVRARDGRATGVRLADGSVVGAGAILVAAGPWSPGLLDPTGGWRPIRPQWGVVAEVALGEPPRHVLEESGMDEALGRIALTQIGPYGPDDGPDDHGDRPDFSLVTAAGRSALGSTFLEAEPDAEAWLPRLVARGRRFVPAIGRARTGPIRVCARPSALDQRPLLGPVPGMPGVFLAAGHGPWGISTGPASSRLVCAAILGERAPIAPELDAARFGAPDTRAVAPG
jgi:glycine/D-amino acid oxidase-like deaminating enzyme